MQPQVHAFVRTAAETFEFHGPVYEFSYCPGADVPRDGWPSQWADGSPPPEGRATQAERPEGEVDRLDDLSRLPFPDRSARTVLSIGALEHAFEPRRAVDEMIRLLAPGGMLVLSAVCDGRPVERTDDYWRPTPGAIGRLLSPLDATLVGWQGAEQLPHTLFGVGFKGPLSDPLLERVNRFLQRFQARLSETAATMGWWARLHRALAMCVQTRDERRRTRDYHKAQFVVQMPVDQNARHRLLAGCLPGESPGGNMDLGR